MKNEAISYLKMENKLMKLQGMMYDKQRNKSMASLQKAQEEYQQVEDILKEAMKGLEDIKAKQQEKQRESDEIMSEFDKLNKQVETLNEKLKSLDKRVNRTAAKIQIHSKRVRRS